MRPNSIYLKTILCLALMALFLFSISAEAKTAEPPANILALCREFNALNSAVRDRTVKKPAAKEQFSKLIDAIRMEYYASVGQDYPVSDWVFPLQGYGYKAIGGVKGNGYQRGGYDYFDGNRHAGHPSQDLFIRDRQRRSLDDATNKPVSVLSLTGGVVVAVEKVWATPSPLRGGKYLWIYDPTANALIYYAHNSRLLVEVGDIVKPGDVIAEVGRTGLNAHKRRSPSHLHLTYLAIVNGLPVPRNIYKELRGSKLQ
jgi:murein DD-endopeptidase MepM/ murein hydrolase activator NlpD